MQCPDCGADVVDGQSCDNCGLAWGLIRETYEWHYTREQDDDQEQEEFDN